VTAFRQVTRDEGALDRLIQLSIPA